MVSHIENVKGQMRHWSVEMRRLTVNTGVFFVSLSVTLLGCTPIARNSIDFPANGEKKYGRQEISQRQASMSQSPPSAAPATSANVASATENNQATNNASAKVNCAALSSDRRNIYFKSASDSNEKLTTVKVGATGYGAPPKNYYPEGQRRLMTMRASKLDAYRALAEIVGGLHVWGGSAIADMVIERDRYRMFVDSFVRGAHVVSVEAMEDNTYKTIVEMEVDQRFLNHVMTFIDPAADRYCYEQEADGTTKYYGYTVAPSFYYSE